MGNIVQVLYNTMPTIDKNLPFVWYQIWVLGPLLLLSAQHNQKVESALTITYEVKLLRTNNRLGDIRVLVDEECKRKIQHFYFGFQESCQDRPQI